KKWKFSLGAKTSKSDGENYVNPNYGLVASASETKNTWFDMNTFTGSVGRDLGAHWKVSLRSSYDERSFAGQYFYTANIYDESVENTTVFFNDLKFTGSHGKFKTDVDFAYRESTDEYIFNPLFTRNSHKTKFGLFQFNQSFAYSDKHKFVYGTQLDMRSIESNDRGDHDNFHAGIYGQWIGNVVKNLTSTISLRGDYDDNYEFELSPQISLSYLYKSLVIRGGAGRGIRAADYTERFVSNNLVSLSEGRNLGNPDLVAETSWSYELGADYYFSQGFKAIFTGFYRASDNIIDYVPTLGSDISNVPVAIVPEGTYLYTQNLTVVNTAGIEFELWYAKEFTNKSKVNVKLGYTFLDSKNPDGVVSKYVSSHATNLINGNIIYSVSNVDFGVTGLYKERKSGYSDVLNVELKPSYFVANANIGFRLLDNRLTLKGEVLNVFDEEYSDILGAIMPGRWYMVGMSLNL
ncbi:MAG: vitamin B12 transporter, partial [Dokdonia sp.]